MAQIEISVAGQIAIEALRAAMTSAEIPSEYRAHMIGFFCNEWNEKTKPIAEIKEQNKKD